MFSTLLAGATAFTENFDAGWEDRWVAGAKDDLGKFVSAEGGIKTSEDAKFYGLSTSHEKISNVDGKLVVQVRVKHAQNIDCGGGYVKLFPSTVEGSKMDGDSPYNIMFGPDICGPGTRKVHVIFEYKGKNLLTKKNIPCKTDELSHLYTLTVDSAEHTYQVDIDGEKEHSGSLYDDFDFLEPKEIKDPAVSKPTDWVDETQIDDPDDKKPDDWVEISHIADPDAEKPDDWDDEMDGEWEAPQIDNPDYKGEWKAKRIDNPAYKGEWEHPLIANPDFVDDDTVGQYSDFGRVGIDVWQVKSGTIFDDIVVTKDADEAAKGLEAFKVLAAEEAEAKKIADEKAEEERKAKEAEEAAAAEAAKDDEADAEEGEDADAVKDEL